jgi:hypothetical protein
MVKILEEFIYEHLEEWNNTQKDLWIKLSSLKKVDKNDTFKFIKFSSWFDYFFLKHNCFPTLEEAIKYFIIDT